MAIYGNFNDNQDSIIIGTIDLGIDDALNEVTTIKDADGKEIALEKHLTCTIEIRGRELAIPHFHLYNTTKGFYAAIYIYEPNYFEHQQYRDRLTNKQKEILVGFLSKRNQNPKLTNWQRISEEWKINNPDYVFKNNISDKQPDYMQLPPKK